MTTRGLCASELAELQRDVAEARAFAGAWKAYAKMLRVRLTFAQRLADDDEEFEKRVRDELRDLVRDFDRWVHRDDVRASGAAVRELREIRAVRRLGIALPEAAEYDRFDEEP